MLSGQGGSNGDGTSKWERKAEGIYGKVVSDSDGEALSDDSLHTRARVSDDSKVTSALAQVQLATRSVGSRDNIHSQLWQKFARALSQASRAPERAPSAIPAQKTRNDICILLWKRFADHLRLKVLDSPPSPSPPPVVSPELEAKVREEVTVAFQTALQNELSAVGLMNDEDTDRGRRNEHSSIEGKKLNSITTAMEELHDLSATAATALHQKAKELKEKDRELQYALERAKALEHELALERQSAKVTKAMHDVEMDDARASATAQSRAAECSLVVQKKTAAATAAARAGNEAEMAVSAVKRRVAGYVAVLQREHALAQSAVAADRAAFSAQLRRHRSRTAALEASEAAWCSSNLEHGSIPQAQHGGVPMSAPARLHRGNGDYDVSTVDAPEEGSGRRQDVSWPVERLAGAFAENAFELEYETRENSSATDVATASISPYFAPPSLPVPSVISPTRRGLANAGSPPESLLGNAAYASIPLTTTDKLLPASPLVRIKIEEEKEEEEVVVVDSEDEKREDEENNGSGGGGVAYDNDHECNEGEERYGDKAYKGTKQVDIEAIEKEIAVEESIGAVLNAAIDLSCSGIITDGYDNLEEEMMILASTRSTKPVVSPSGLVLQKTCEVYSTFMV